MSGIPPGTIRIWTQADVDISDRHACGYFLLTLQYSRQKAEAHKHTTEPDTSAVGLTFPTETNVPNTVPPGSGAPAAVS